MTKKKMTIDNLAAMTQRGFTDIKTQMATKEDLKKLATKEELNKLRVEMKEGFSGVFSAIENLDVRISSYATEWNKRFDELHEWVEHIEDRLKSLERRFAKT
ncbi:MAG: hypothetical protein NTX55_01870 [Candidatus Parcubacteria bacterium]|nr:hypothetical protein [Candidatus Parcubacteria bacterium]